MFCIIFYGKLLLYNDLSCYNAESPGISIHPLAFSIFFPYNNIYAEL